MTDTPETEALLEIVKRRQGQWPGRNDLCTCGSEKKAKHCCFAHTFHDLTGRYESAILEYAAENADLRRQLVEARDRALVEAADQVAPAGEEPSVDPTNPGDLAELERWHSDSASRDAVLALRTQPTPPALAADDVRVKPLEWEKMTTSLTQRASCIIGTYIIAQYEEDVFFWWFSGQGEPKNMAKGSAQAKAAAQIDYKRRIRRILSTLAAIPTPAPAADDVREG